MSKTLSKAALVCHAAAEIIERNGWCQGTGFTEAGERCLVNALSFVADGKYILEGEAIHLLGFSCGPDVIDWNDAPGRTKKEVLQRLRSVR